MTHFSFEIRGELRIHSQLSKPLKAVTARFGPASRPYKLFLTAVDGSTLTIEAQMHDVAERFEIGVLCFTMGGEPATDDVRMTVPPPFRVAVNPMKLMVTESGVSAESGILLTGNDEEIFICAGVYPYSIAFKGLGNLPHAFEPEFPVERYSRVPLE